MGLRKKLRKVTKVVSAKRLVNTAIGAGTGFATGGFPGAIAGGATGALKKTGKMNFKSALTGAAIGLGTGAVVGGIAGTGWAGKMTGGLLKSAAPNPLTKAGGFMGSSVSLLSKGKGLLTGAMGMLGMGGGAAPAEEEAGAYAENAAMIVDENGMAVAGPSPDQQKNRMYLYIGIGIVLLLILRK